jgi:uncharacterized protein
MKNLKNIFFLFLSQNLMACCGEINYSIFSILHDKGTKYSAFAICVDSSEVIVDSNFKSYATIVENYSNPKRIKKQIEIFTGGENSAGGTRLQKGKYYFVLGYEFEQGKFSAFVCDVHSKRLSDNADSSLIITKMLDYKRHNEQKYTGKVKYFDHTILLAEGALKKGIPNGQWKYYGKRGELIAEISYKMGEKVGLEKHFNDDILAQLYRNNKNRIFEEYRTNEFGKISTICIHKFDKKGYWTSVRYNYYQNGNLRMKSMYFSGISNYLSSSYIGDYEEYTEDGKVIGKGKYDRGAKVGIWLEQNPKDSSLETKIYPQIKTKKGIFTWFYANGIKSVQGVLDKKGKQGIWVQYNEKGDTLYFGKYVNDREQGDWKYFYANKNVESIRFFVDGKENGEFIRFYENGIIESEGTYKAGNIYGKWKAYYTDGKLKNITNYNEKGQQHGESIIYAQSGKVLRNITYINDYIDGDYVFYAEKGNVLEKGKYDNGIKIGEWLTYYENGKIRQRCIYTKTPNNPQEAECEYFN